MLALSGMKDALYNHQWGATAACMLRLLESTIPENELQICRDLWGDVWFCYELTASDVGIHDHEGVFQVKQNLTLQLKSFIEEASKEAPGGAHIFLKGTAPNGVSLVPIGHCYSKKTTFYFVATENYGSTIKGYAYVMKYTDSYGNISTHLVDRPDLIANFFASSNAIGTHDQLCQFNSTLHWSLSG